MHATSSDGPLDDASLRAKAIAVYREMCGLSVEQSALTLNRDLERGTWCARPQGGLPDHFASLAKYVGGSVVLLRTNTYIIVTLSFGMDSALTSATVWVLGRGAPLCVHGCGDMEEHCQRATMVVIAEAERDGHGSDGHLWAAVFDHSLQVAPFCTLHRIMSMLPYRTGSVGGSRVRHLRLGVGGMKGHNNATHFHHTCLVQQTRNYKPLATLVNSKGLVAQMVHVDYHAVVSQCAHKSASALA